MRRARFAAASGSSPAAALNALAAVAGAVLAAFMLLVYLGYIAIWFPVGPPYNVDEEPQQFEQEIRPEES